MYIPLYVIFYFFYFYLLFFLSFFIFIFLFLFFYFFIFLFFYFFIFFVKQEAVSTHLCGWANQMIHFFFFLSRQISNHTGRAIGVRKGERETATYGYVGVREESISVSPAIHFHVSSGCVLHVRWSKLIQKCAYYNISYIVIIWFIVQ